MARGIRVFFHTRRGISLLPRMLRIKRNRKRSKVELSRRSPFSGMPFPEGFKRIAFTAYCDSNGNVRATQRALKDAGERAPSNKTLHKWIEKDHWEVLRQVQADGLLAHLEADQDPDIREAIKTDAALFKFMLRLRSQLLVKLSTKDSHLMPTNTNEVVRLLGYLDGVIQPIQSRMSEAEKRKAVQDDDEDTPDYANPPDNVVSLSEAIRGRGEQVSQLSLAREAIRARDSK